MTDDEEIIALLGEIRDGQQRQLALQDESLSLQRRHLEQVERQFERAERIQQRAEALQDRSAAIVAVARRALWVVLPLIALLLGILFWMMFR